MANRGRRKFSSEEKVEILKRHLLEKEVISDICEGLKISPNLFYRWQKEFFDNGALAFNRPVPTPNHQTRILEEKVKKLESDVSHKNQVIADITESYVELKKNSGEA